MRKQRHLLSYLAGVFDGEGCVAVEKTKPTAGTSNKSLIYRASMRIRMTDEIMPLLFRNVFGGYINKQKGVSQNHRVQYQWTLKGHCCLPVLKELLPFVILKRPQFEVVIHFLENTPTGGGFAHTLTDKELTLREVDYILCKDLKGRINNRANLVEQ